MEETLGKRIAAHRKRLGLTQDRLAEILGVTAQAVSKWENDQSCPDIAMLPKLAETFHCTTDELLGIQQEQETVHTAEVLPHTEDPESQEDQNGKFVFDMGDIHFESDNGKKTGIFIALWVLLTGGLLLVPGTQLWTVLWTTGLTLFGLAGLWRHLSVFRVGCVLFGGYALLSHLSLLPFSLDKKYLLPIFLLLFGLSLLVDALKKPRKKHLKHIVRSNRTVDCSCDIDDECFTCSVCFGEQHYPIDLHRLSHGSAEVCFGSLTVDISGCEEIDENCVIDLEASFGSLELRIPRCIRAVLDSDTAFGNVKAVGSPDPDAQNIISVNCEASFGQITLRYI